MGQFKIYEYKNRVTHKTKIAKGTKRTKKKKTQNTRIFENFKKIHELVQNTKFVFRKN